MKTLYLIGGTMGVGKTTVAKALRDQTDHCVFLDGDWCWDAHPFKVTEQTKAMVMDNITYLINNFIHCPDYETIIFCWVMHEQNIIDALLDRLDTKEVTIKAISLVCRAEILEKRIMTDVRKGLRDEEVIARSISRLPLYQKLRTVQIDTSDLSLEEIVDKLQKTPPLAK